MAFARASAIRGALRAVRPSKTSVGRAQQWRQIGRRGYASHGHDTKKASSDLPWLVGAVAVTVPTCWYLIQNGPEAHHGGHGDEHGEEHGDKHGKEHEDEPESKDDNKSSEKGDDSDSGDESKEADTPDTSDDEDGKDEKEGKPEDLAEGADSESKDTPAASKPAGSQSTQSGKQEGLSNTDTKHSVDLANNPEKSRKGGDTPETSKSKGTVDPKRSQAESNIGKK